MECRDLSAHAVKAARRRLISTVTPRRGTATDEPLIMDPTLRTTDRFDTSLMGAGWCLVYGLALYATRLQPWRGVAATGNAARA